MLKKQIKLTRHGYTCAQSWLSWKFLQRLTLVLSFPEKGVPACDLQRLRTNNFHILAIHVRPKETKMTRTQLRRFRVGSLKLPSIFSSSKIPLQYNTSSNKMHHKLGIPTSSKEGFVLWLWFKTRMAVSFPI